MIVEDSTLTHEFLRYRSQGRTSAERLQRTAEFLDMTRAAGVPESAIEDMYEDAFIHAIGAPLVAKRVE